MNLTLYVYVLEAKKIRGKMIEDVKNFEDDFVKAIKYNLQKNLVDRKMDLLDIEKIEYLNMMSYSKDEHTVLLEFKSAKYANVRKVVDTETMEEQRDKKKGAKDGDVETTYIMIKFDQSAKTATAILQVNSNGVSMKKIVTYLDECIHLYHKDYKQDAVRYKIGARNHVSKDFLNALVHADRIKMVKLVVAEEEVEVSEYKEFSELNDINENVDIIMKPVKRGAGISRDTVKKLYNMYKKGDGTIKRIWVASDDESNNPLSFDTEKMREKINLEVNESITGEPETEDVKNALKRSIASY